MNRLHLPETDYQAKFVEMYQDLQAYHDRGSFELPLYGFEVESQNDITTYYRPGVAENAAGSMTPSLQICIWKGEADKTMQAVVRHHYVHQLHEEISSSLFTISADGTQAQHDQRTEIKNPNWPNQRGKVKEILDVGPSTFGTLEQAIATLKTAHAETHRRQYLRNKGWFGLVRLELKKLISS